MYTQELLEEKFTGHAPAPHPGGWDKVKKHVDAILNAKNTGIRITAQTEPMHHGAGWIVIAQGVANGKKLRARIGEAELKIPTRIGETLFFHTPSDLSVGNHKVDFFTEESDGELIVGNVDIEIKA